MRNSFAGKLAFMLLVCCCTQEDFAEARRSHYRPHHRSSRSRSHYRPHHRSSRSRSHRDEHRDTQDTHAKGEAVRPYYYASPIDTGFVHPDYFNLYNFSPSGYLEGGYNDPLANPAAKTSWFMAFNVDYDTSEPHPWFDENSDN